MTRMALTAQWIKTGCYVRLLNFLCAKHLGLRLSRETELDIAEEALRRNAIRSDCYVNSVWDYCKVFYDHFFIPFKGVTYIRFDGERPTANILCLQLSSSTHFVAGKGVEWFDSSGRTRQDYLKYPVVYSAKLTFR